MGPFNRIRLWKLLTWLVSHGIRRLTAVQILLSWRMTAFELRNLVPIFSTRDQSAHPHSPRPPRSIAQCLPSPIPDTSPPPSPAVPSSAPSDLNSAQPTLKHSTPKPDTPPNMTRDLPRQLIPPRNQNTPPDTKHVQHPASS